MSLRFPAQIWAVIALMLFTLGTPLTAPRAGETINRTSAPTSRIIEEEHETAPANTVRHVRWPGAASAIRNTQRRPPRRISPSGIACTLALAHWRKAQLPRPLPPDDPVEDRSARA